jgi:hypothetical protein
MDLVSASLLSQDNYGLVMMMMAMVMMLQSNNESSLRPSEFVRSLAMQILSHSSRRARPDSSRHDER